MVVEGIFQAGPADGHGEMSRGIAMGNGRAAGGGGGEAKQFGFGREVAGSSFPVIDEDLDGVSLLADAVFYAMRFNLEAGAANDKRMVIRVRLDLEGIRFFGDGLGRGRRLAVGSGGMVALPEPGAAGGNA